MILLLANLPLFTHAQDVFGNAEILPEVVVVGKAEDLIGEAKSASSGQASHEELSERPTLRRGELLEVIPGFISTQHSGGGKANQ